MKSVIGIRPVIDGRWGGVRESLEEKTMNMAQEAAKLIRKHCFYDDGTSANVVISPTTIGGVTEASECEAFFRQNNVTATLTVTPCWCYGTETMDVNPHTIKGVWGFNGTERPGAVYLAAVMAAHAQKGLPAFAIYGKEVQNLNDDSIPPDVQDKIIQFSQAALAVGQMRDKSYVGIGSISMGIMGSYVSVDFFQKYLGIRTEFVDMTEVKRRIELNIFDQKEYKKALEWTLKYCVEGFDYNQKDKQFNQLEKKAQWEFVVKMTLIFKDILVGNPKLIEIGFPEESLGRNGLIGGFQGQRMWTDFLPNGDFAEAILNSSFDWNGIRKPFIFATENDSLNAVSMLFGHLLTGSASVFADVRTYWSSDAIEKATGWKPDGLAGQGIIHLINSGAAALDATGRAVDENGKHLIKPWWKMTEKDVFECLSHTKFCPANRDYMRGGGFSSKLVTEYEMPVTIMRVNIIDGVGPTLQIAEGYTLNIPEKVSNTLWERTDPAWPSTWFTPLLNKEPAFKDVYSLMSNWGSNHASLTYGHIGHQLITLASMLRIPVSLHNVDSSRILRPHSFSSFGTKDLESADYRACNAYGPIYK